MLKKESLLKGTIILAAAALVARFLGLFQRIPLDYMLGNEGNIAFTNANQVYMIVLMIATAGFPSAISKMVSERYALGRPDEAQRIYRAGLLFGLIAGFVLAIALYVLAPLYGAISKEPGSVLAIRAIAPALLFFPLVAMMRGYFQGRQMMSVGGTSQIVEQFARVILGLLLGWLVLELGWGDRWAAAAITFGSVFGGIAAFAVMLRFARKLKKQDASSRKPARRMSAEASAALRPSFSSPSAKTQSGTLTNRGIYKEILSMSIPSLVTSMSINVLLLFDVMLFNRLTGNFYTLVESKAVAADYGIKAISLAGIPPILAIALGSSIIPIISSAFSLKNMDEVRRQASMVMRIVCFTGVPVALLLTVASFSVTGLLFAGPSGSGPVAALSAAAILQITMMTSNSIIYGMGKPKLSMTHTLIGLGLKVAVSIALGPFLGIYGLIIGSAVCFIVVTMLNLRSINGIVKLQVLGARWVPYIAAVALSALAGWGAELGVLSLTSTWANKLSYLLAAIAAAAVVGGLYVVLLLMLRVIRPEDVTALPRPLRGPFNKLLRVFQRAGA
ncbi:polysaccharide biosynthesis protein [Paenibacillus sp. 1011MAR3C5]|uniref:putative polysaccharide biosynthesis protein n=1 Tax=Paenibacillus sp. 1011MAR3C5 TaxID=1675787 RepID=UPI000E6D017F|nr:polysaccharide biosynthesis protein [Paenibacillus sp. 1011MAR3C5]RJE88918.1 polysaccharide biosynthesis protein [Paenibacillus sp. 1011MAR3C5]